MSTEKTTSKNYYEKTAEKLADLIEKNEAPFQKQWEAGTSYLPYNMKSGKEYQGVNVFNLMTEPYSDPRWLTYNQAKELGGAVLKDETGTKIIYVKTTEKIKDKDDKGNILKDENGKDKEITVLLEKPIVMLSTVFNAQQCSGLPPLDLKAKSYDWQPIDKAQEIIDKSGVSMVHRNQNAAFYRPLNDTIYMPIKQQFTTPEKYYRVTLHELGHATGSESRLNRKGVTEGKRNDKKTIAHEELVAEITSFMTGSIVGLGHEPTENNIAYIKNWSEYIKNDPKYLVKACQEADKATKFIVGDLKIEQNLAREGQIMNNEPLQYINVPFSEKEEAKTLGAKWDKNAKSFFIPAGVENGKFAKWENTTADEISKQRTEKEATKMKKDEKKFFIAVPYSDKDEAKKLGAKWDNTNSSWYCSPENKDEFAKWHTENAVNVKNDIALAPESEFFNRIAEKGFIGDVNDIIADGNKHRIAVEGDKPKEMSGFYVLHADGVPNGYFMNNRTSETEKWVQKGYDLSDEDKKNLKTVALAKTAERKQLLVELENKAVGNLKDFFSKAQPMNVADSKYFENKAIQPTENIFKSPYGEIAIPLTNIKGEITSAQYINSEGEKRFAANTRKTGSFHLLNGRCEDLATANRVIVAEGYSTAVSVAEAINDKSVKVIASMGASNIENVVASIQTINPDVKIALAVDNDKALKDKGIKNVGLETANNVATKYQNVTTVVPKFNGRTVAGDFNDLVKKYPDKDKAAEGIKLQFEKALEKANSKDKIKGGELRKEPKKEHALV